MALIRVLPLTLTMTLTLLSLPAVSGRSDVPGQYYKLFRNKVSLNRVTPPDPLPDHVTKRLNGLTFESLPPALQHALLWDMGLVQSGDSTRNAYVQVQVPCGNTMSDIFLTKDVLTDKAQCGLVECNAQFLHFTLSNCSLSAVQPLTKCGFAPNVPVNAVTSNAVWMEDGEIDAEAAISVYLKEATVKTNTTTTTTTLYTIQERPKLNLIDDRQSCPPKATFIIPCRQLNTTDVQSGAWCDPTYGVLVDLWLTEQLADQLNANKLDDKTKAVTTFTALFIAAAVLCVGLGVCVWKKRVHRKTTRSTGGRSNGVGGSGGASSGLMDLDHHDHHVLMTHNHLTSESENTTAPGHPNERASFTTAELEKINANFCDRSRDLAEFCGDQELMMKRISYASLHFSTLIARGANGEVWRGEYAGQEVAIKRMLRDKQGEVIFMEIFAREIRLASTLEHPNVVKFIGLSWRSLSELCMVSEFMPTGDLAHYLLSKESRGLTWRDQKMSLALDIANALVYLHSLMPVIIHRDLKSLNVLLNENLEAKLSDFGLSRERSFEETMTSGVGTMLWTAPEVLRGDRYTEKADIYSYGVVLSELDTCLPPYSLNEAVARAKQKSAQLLPLIRKGEIKPQFRESVPKVLHELALSCLEYVPEKRPNAMQIVYILRSKVMPTLV